ncbi:hypothetical protein HWV62_21118 [Athelia sp. TMB]|nr:hypothetical protein HWV62_21118 [Athelia sp. TMB]
MLDDRLMSLFRVMGLSGAGKSSVSDNYQQTHGALSNIIEKLISMAIGGDFDVIGHELEGRTRTVRAFRCWDPASQRHYVLIDTPGFDDTYLSDADILIDIARWLNTTYRRKILLKGILYLHRITDNRMSASALRNSDMFRHLCGDAGLANVILVTTMWGDVHEEACAVQDEQLDRLKEREAELQGFFWQSMVDHGSQTARFYHTPQSAWDVIGQLKEDPVPIQLQRQMVDEHKPLSGTSAGAFLKTWLNVLYKHFKLGAEWLQNNLRSRTDSGHVAELRRQKASLDERMKTVKVQQDRLEVRSTHSAHDGSLPLRDISFPTIQSNPQRRRSMPSKPFRKPFNVRASTVPHVAPEAEEAVMWRKYGSDPIHGVGPLSQLEAFSIEDIEAGSEPLIFGSSVESADARNQTPERPPAPYSGVINAHLNKDLSTNTISERPHDLRSTSAKLDPQEVADEEFVLIHVTNHNMTEIQEPRTPPVHTPPHNKPRTAASRLLAKAQFQMRSSNRNTADLSDLRHGNTSTESVQVDRKLRAQQDLPRLKTYADSIHSQLTSASSSSRKLISRPYSQFLKKASSSQTTLSAPDSGISMSSKIYKFLRTPKKSHLLMPVDHSGPHSDNGPYEVEPVIFDTQILASNVSDPVNVNLKADNEQYYLNLPFKQAADMEEKSRSYTSASLAERPNVPTVAGEELSRSEKLEKYKPELWLAPLEDIDWEMEGESIPHVSPDPQNWDIDLYPIEIVV